MKLNFLNTITKRVGFSFGISALILLGSGFFQGFHIIDLYSISLITLCVFVPVTLFYAIVSTFFVKEEQEKSDELLDD